MNKQKLISILQSRIAKRRKQITFFSEHEKNYTARLALEQKEDKQILKQLVMDEMSVKKWKKAFAEADLMLWELQQREG